MDFIPRRPRIDKDGKVILKADGEPEMTRGTERLLIGSNGSIYLTLDHYHTFILLID
nr:ribonuclease domain-containing protein [Rothia dentocariosa]